MKKIIMKIICIFNLIVCVLSLCSFNDKQYEDSSNTCTTIYSLDELYQKNLRNSQIKQSNLMEIDSYLKNSFNTQYSDKWRVGLIEHRVFVDFDENSVHFYRDKIISKDSDYFIPSGLSTFEYTTTTRFTHCTTISTANEVKLVGESTIAFGAVVPNAQLSTSQKIQTQYTTLSAKEYSTGFEVEKSYKLIYDMSQLQIPQNSSFALGTVGDYFEFNVYIREEKYFWWGTQYEYEYSKMTCRIYTFTYNTFIFSNGKHDAKTDRPY